ncbi:MAG: cysteine desulfurase [Alkalicoccus sp.]|nr:MAG: cysteine desulfurase [Alkalicoccus sp.]
MDRIYLDHAATSPVHPEVVEAMLPYFTEKFGNPSSIHSFGREARAALDEARGKIAAAIGASYNEIVFTGGGTEADNLAVIGGAKKRGHKGKHIITAVTEHHGVLHACSELEQEGYEVTYLKVAEDGKISIDDLKDALREDTILVSLMTVNNETGTIQPVKEVGNVLKDHQALFHTDAVQAAGKYPLDVEELKVDLMACSAHKFNGPNGIGFLYVRQGTALAPISFGGDQERKRRAGTENTAGITGMKTALETALSNMEARKSSAVQFRKLMLDVFDEQEINYEVNGDPEEGLPHVLNVSFPEVNVEQFLMNMDLEGIAVSSGSACTAGSVDPSHVLIGMHGVNDRSRSAVRFSFGYGNTAEQVESAAKTASRILGRIKATK